MKPDWDKLMKKEIPVPWEPTISGSLDTSQFDKEFTNMPILSPEQQTSRLAQFDNKLFDGFTFKSFIGRLRNDERQASALLSSCNVPFSVVTKQV